MTPPFSLAIQYPLNLRSIYCTYHVMIRRESHLYTLRIPGSISSTDLRRDLWSAATPWKSPARYYPLCGVSAASCPPCRAEVDSPTQQMTAGAQQEPVPGQR